MKKKELLRGIRDSVPIALGYLAVSFSFGILAVTKGLNVFQATVTSLSNVTSAGQFAALSIIAASGSLMELAATQLVINLRYALMSIALSQKLHMPAWKKALIAFGNTDEIFAVSVSREERLTGTYMAGLEIPSILGWTVGTFLGGIAGNILPESLLSALSVALYGMFAAIVLPVARKSRPVAVVALLAVVFSCVFYFALPGVSSGIAIILCTLAAAIVGSLLYPVAEEAAS